MADRETHAIISAGLAGAKTAQALRDEGFEGRIVLLGSEPEQPYERPPLSKGYLRGEEPRYKALVHADDYSSASDIELRTATTVASVDVKTRELELDGGERL